MKHKNFHEKLDMKIIPWASTTPMAPATDNGDISNRFDAESDHEDIMRLISSATTEAVPEKTESKPTKLPAVPVWS